VPESNPEFIHRTTREHQPLTSTSRVLPDSRSPAMKDRDRVLYAAAFRRLSGVTQVVAPNQPHLFHNRLTHTLEVAQIARRIAERIRSELQQKGEISEHFIDADVVETAALVHDLGHPPFGHIAEDELDTLARGVVEIKVEKV
jgi:dGTPase